MSKRYTVTLKDGKTYCSDDEAMRQEAAALQNMFADTYKAYAKKTGRSFEKYTDNEEMMFIGANAFCSCLATICAMRVRDGSSRELLDTFIELLNIQYSEVRRRLKDGPPQKQLTGHEIN